MPSLIGLQEINGTGKNRRSLVLVHVTRFNKKGQMKREIVLQLQEVHFSYHHFIKVYFFKCYIITVALMVIFPLGLPFYCYLPLFRKNKNTYLT